LVFSRWLLAAGWLLEELVDELRLGDQMACYDRDATIAAYALMPVGGADRCACVHCRNFTAQRDSVYPKEFRNLLSQLGIDPNKEGEVYDMVGPCDLRVRPTGGWFYFAGQLIEPGEKLSTGGRLPVLVSTILSSTSRLLRKGSCCD
jgi:hypothetical protein